MVKGIGHVYKHTRRSWPYPSPNKNVFVPPRSVSSQKKDSTRDCGASTIAITRPSPKSKLTTIDNFDTDVNNNDDSQSFVTPRKHNHSATELRDRNNTTTLVQLKPYPRLFQHSPYTPTASLKIPPSRKWYLCFKTYSKNNWASQCNIPTASGKVID